MAAAGYSSTLPATVGKKACKRPLQCGEAQEGWQGLKSRGWSGEQIQKAGIEMGQYWLG